MIDTKSQEIKPAADETYSDMLELADELPDSSPRFILLSYPLTLVRYSYAGIIVITHADRVRRPVACPSHTSCYTTYPRTATRAIE
jgi:hypothetical protein